MPMPMRGNVIHGISCHHHHDELFVCQCVLQPAIPVRMCVCLCVQRARQCRQQAGEHTPPKKKRGREKTGGKRGVRCGSGDKKNTCAGFNPSRLLLPPRDLDHLATCRNNQNQD